MPKYGKRLVSLAFTPDGDRLAACSEGAAVTLFDTASGRKLAEVEGTSNFQADGGYELAFLSRGRLAMAMLEKESIRLLDVSSSRFVKTLRGHTGFVCGIVPGPGGLSLVSASLDGTFRFWSLDEREGPQVVDARPVPITRVAYSPDGRWLATAGGQGPVALMDPQKRGRNGQAPCERIAGRRPGFQHRRTLAGVRHGMVHAPNRTDRVGPRHPRGQVHARTDTRMGEQESRSGGLVAFHPDGRTLACAGGLKGGSIRVFDVESGRLRHGWDGRWGPVRSLAYSPDGRLLASGYRDHLVNLRDTTSGELLPRSTAL